MANTRSAKKALRQSNTKRSQNQFWKKRIRAVVKNIREQLQDKSVTADIIKKEEAVLYKIVDKAAKKNVIHRNKARRIKSRVSKQISANAKTKTATKSKKTTKSSTKRASKA